MGIKISYLDFLLRNLPSDYQGLDMLELGNQRLKGDNSKWKDYLINKKIINSSDLIPSVGKELFEKLGFDCISIDINGLDGSLPYDLSEPIELKFSVGEVEGRYLFDVVVDFGVTEHVINQYQCFLNIFNFLKPGGIVAHLLPARGFVVHGLYSYDSILFYILGQFGIYDIVDCPIIRPKINSKLISVVLRKKDTGFLSQQEFDLMIGKYIWKN